MTEDTEARLETLAKERDLAREECGFEKAMRKHISTELSGWIKRCLAAEDCEKKRCPDCNGPMELLGDVGTAGVGDIITELEWFVCAERHVWARCAPPVQIEPFYGEAGQGP